MKRYTAILSALALTASMILSSCAQEQKQDHYNDEHASVIAAENKSSESSTAQRYDHSFNCKEADLPEGIDFIDSFTSINNDTEIMIIGSSYDYNHQTPSVFITDKTFTDFRSVILEETDEIKKHLDRYTNYFPQPDGSICAFTHTEERSGMKYPETDTEMENFNWDLYYDTEAECEDFISCYDKTGKLISSEKINYDVKYDSDNIVSYYGDNNFIIMIRRNGSIVRANTDGSTVELRPADKAYNDELSNSFISMGIGKTRNGKWIYMENKDECINDQWVCSTSASIIDTESGKLSDPFYKNDDSASDCSLYIGYDYALFEDDWNSLYGIDENGQKTEIINWKNSDLSSMRLTGIGQNEYIGFQDMGENGKIVILSPKDSSDFANITTLTINSSYNEDIINQFNRSQDKYRVVMAEDNEETPSFDTEEDYTQYCIKKEDKLALDIISGKAPDIILDLNYSTMVNLGKKGALTNLYEFMDNDTEINRNAIMPNLLKALESSDGKLFNMCSQFGLETIIAKTSVCDKESWTFEDMIALYDNAPASATHLYDGESKEQMFRTMFDMIDGVVDYEKGSCNFDNPEIVKLLEFCNRFVDTVSIPDKSDDNWEAHQMYYADRAQWWGRGETLLEFIPLDDVSFYGNQKYNYSDGSDITFVGYPSNNGKGGRILPRDLIAVSNSCSDKQGAWEFVKFYISHNDDYDPYAVLFASAKRTDEALYNALTADNTANGRPMANIKEADRLKISEYIRKCDTLYAFIDHNILQICNEEATRYFHGEISAQEAAALMQNRASIVVSEKY